MTTRRTVSRWGEHGPRPTPLRQNEAIFARFAVSISLEVTCSAAAAYALITDITRIGEFSPECIGATWLDGATAPRVGARFEGTNLRVAEGAEHVWIRPCTITVATPPHRFAYTVGDRYGGAPTADWTIDIAPVSAHGCRITQTFQHRPDGLSGIRHRADRDPDHAEGIVAARTADLRQGMDVTLHAMQRVLKR